MGSRAACGVSNHWWESTLTLWVSTWRTPWTGRKRGQSHQSRIKVSVALVGHFQLLPASKELGRSAMVNSSPFLSSSWLIVTSETVVAAEESWNRASPMLRGRPCARKEVTDTLPEVAVAEQAAAPLESLVVVSLVTRR